MSTDRASVWRRFGAPTDQEGSVNDPRTQTDYGVVWNERWIYRGADGRSIARVALFYRYDLVGLFRIGTDGAAEALPLSEA